MPKSSEKGFVVIFPVIVVAAVLVLGFTVSNFKQKTETSAVLSESSSNSGSNSGSGGHSEDDDSEANESTPVPGTTSETARPSESPKLSPRPDIFVSTKTLQFNDKKQNVKTLKRATPKPEKTLRPEQTRKPEATHSPEVEDDEKEIETHSPKPSGVPQEFRVVLTQNSGKSSFNQEKSRVLLSEDLPVEIDEDEQTLTVETANGKEVIGLAPDDALRNVIDSGSVSRVDANPETGLSELKLTFNSNGVPVYEMEGVKEGRFLGVFNVKIKKTVQISAIDGAEGSVTVSGFDRFLDLFSF